MMEVDEGGDTTKSSVTINIVGPFTKLSWPFGSITMNPEHLKLEGVDKHDLTLPTPAPLLDAEAGELCWIREKIWYEER